MNEKAITEFVAYCKEYIKGSEKSEAQTFLDHFFRAIGYKDGYKQAGATLEHKVKGRHHTSFADLVLPSRVLIEMKKSGEDLSKHLQQVHSYWLKLAGIRPKYAILCNFNVFWIYDFEKDIYEPAIKIQLDDLVKSIQSFSFLFPNPSTPVFRNTREAVTKEAASLLSGVFRSLLKRKVKREAAVHYLMQCILSIFVENVNLLPDRVFSRAIRKCLDQQNNDEYHALSPESYDLIGSLFHEMNSKGITSAGSFKNVGYFNGGLFNDTKPIELTYYELGLLESAGDKDWSKVNPAIFGSFFESGMDKEERHISGAHYTYEIDIKKIVDPVIVQPWEAKIEQACSTENPLEQFYVLLDELRTYKVLDPACGSGNFLFVAYREMKMIEKEILGLIREQSTSSKEKKRLTQFLSKPFVSTKQFYGIDIKPFAVELAKMTLMVAKELWVTQNNEVYDNEPALPLENLDYNFRCMDALIREDGLPVNWLDVDAIIGNPPFQSKNKMQEEFGAEYVNKIRLAYPEIPGRADFCVYWFYKAHQWLKPNSYAGLVGTNTITQNYSREGSLDYIVNNGGTIYNAVASQNWSGEAAVFVSIACWKKGTYDGIRRLYTYEDDELLVHEVNEINSSLSLNTDVSRAKKLDVNTKPKQVFQGQTHGHEGFLMSKEEALLFLKKSPEYANVLKPFLIGDELVANLNSQPKRFVIDFTGKDMIEASAYKRLYNHVKKLVLPDRKKRAQQQESENNRIKKTDADSKTNKHHINFFNKWWQLSYGRSDMLRKLDEINRFISVPQVALRPTFEVISSEIRPNASLMVFSFDDYYSFGIIQSKLHWEWWKAKCSTLEESLRYTTNTVWDTFPWPQSPTKNQIKKVANAAKKLHEERSKALKENNLTLRDLYRTLEQPGKNPIKELHKKLDEAVMEVYGFNKKGDLLAQLLELNLEVAEREENQESVQAPGLPSFYANPSELITDNCVQFEM